MTFVDEKNPLLIENNQNSHEENVNYQAEINFHDSILEPNDGMRQQETKKNRFGNRLVI